MPLPPLPLHAIRLISSISERILSFAAVVRNEKRDEQNTSTVKIYTYLERWKLSEGEFRESI